MIRKGPGVDPSVIICPFSTTKKVAGWTDQWTNRWMDKPSYGDAWTHLKNKYEGINDLKKLEQVSVLHWKKM